MQYLILSVLTFLIGGSLFTSVRGASDMQNWIDDISTKIESEMPMCSETGDVKQKIETPILWNPGEVLEVKYIECRPLKPSYSPIK